MYLEHRLSALPQLHLHSRLNIWLQRIRQRQSQYSTRIFRILEVMGFGASYIRDLTVLLIRSGYTILSRCPAHCETHQECNYQIGWLGYECGVCLCVCVFLNKVTQIGIWYPGQDGPSRQEWTPNCMCKYFLRHTTVLSVRTMLAPWRLPVFGVFQNEDILAIWERCRLEERDMDRATGSIQDISILQPETSLPFIAFLNKS